MHPGSDFVALYLWTSAPTEETHFGRGRENRCAQYSTNNWDGIKTHRNVPVCAAVRRRTYTRDRDVVLSVEAQRIGARTLVGFNIVAIRTLTESASGGGWKTGAHCSRAPLLWP